MASRRMISSDIWEDQWFGELDFFDQALWVGLFSKCADDQGRLKDNAILIRASVFPYKDFDVSDIEDALKRFADADRLIRYSVGTKDYIQLKNWWRHQMPQWANPSKYPPPPMWVDRVRTNLNKKYMEINWKDEDHARAISHLELQGGSSRWEFHLDGQYHVPVHVPVPKNTAPPTDGGDPSPSPKPKKQASPKAPIPPAVTMFRENAHRYPAKSWYGKIADTVGTKPADLTFWGEVVFDWVGLGWKPTNVSGMLDYYNKRASPADGGNRGKDGRGSGQGQGRGGGPTLTDIEELAGERYGISKG